MGGGGGGGCATVVSTPDYTRTGTPDRCYRVGGNQQRVNQSRAQTGATALSTRRGFRWPSSEKKPREVSDAHLEPLAAFVRPQRASATRAFCRARRALQNGPGAVAELEPTKPGSGGKVRRAGASPSPGLHCWQVVEFKTTQTTAPTAEVLNALQERARAHPGQDPNPSSSHHLRRWRRCSLAGLSCLPRRDLFARPRLELPPVVGRVVAAARAAAGGGGVSGVSESA